MPEGVAPSWALPQKEMPTMIDANFSLADTERGIKHEKCDEH